MQWAAVIIVFSSRIVPPHACVVRVRNLRCKETTNGRELGATSVPPTIFPSGISGYLPFRMTEMGRRGSIIRWGAPFFCFIFKMTFPDWIFETYFVIIVRYSLSSYQRRKRRGRPEQSTSFSTPLCFLRGRNEHYNALSYAMLVSFIINRHIFYQSKPWEAWEKLEITIVFDWLFSLTWPYTDLLNCIFILLHSSTAREYCFSYVQ